MDLAVESDDEEDTDEEDNPVIELGVKRKRAQNDSVVAKPRSDNWKRVAKLIVILPSSLVSSI